MLQASEQIGEISATAYMRTEFPGSERVFGTPEGLPGRRGQFDHIWRQQLDDGSVRYIVVEAKGGASGTSTAKVNGQTVAQGTSEYFDHIIKLTADRAGPGQQIARQLRDAREFGRTAVNGQSRKAEVMYIRVQTPVETLPSAHSGEAPTNRAGRTSVRQFDISRRE